MPSPDDFKVSQLGPRTVDAARVGEISHVAAHNPWIEDHERIPYEIRFKAGEAPSVDRAFERAGMREKLYFDPKTVKAGIVTCGGTCPGLNDVIRSLFMTLHHTYGVAEVYGFQYGFRGLDPQFGLDPILFTHEGVVDLHTHGGTILGTARGRVDADVMVATLRDMGIHLLFVVGGDGSQKGAHTVHEAAKAQGYDLAVVGIPKTIDNDISFVSKTFGFDTAVTIARQALDAAHVEAQGNPGGIGLVKVMGRDSGFIAAHATLASHYVNATLIPELPFSLDKLLAYLENRLTRPEPHRRRAVIVVAEGAGQDLMAGDAGRDASGNQLHQDIGVFLKARISAYFQAKGIETNLKYIDPSYMVRAVPTNAADSIYAAELARFAVHAAMAGKTDVMIGMLHNHYIHVPIPLATSSRRRIDPKGRLWRSVVQATGQPPL